MSTLILSLPAHLPSTRSTLGYILSVDGQQASSYGDTHTTLLPDPGRAGEIVAVVPITALSWLRVTLPQGLALNHTPRLRAVLEGLLEEHLLDEPAQLHFALAPDAQAGQSTWVAVCARDWLQQWLHALEQASRPVGRIVPEFAPGDAPEGEAMAASTTPHYCVLGTPEAPQLLAHSQGTEQSLVLVPLAAAPLVLAQSPALAQQAHHTIQADPAVARLAEQVLGRPVALCTAQERALQAAARSSWDLAQLDLARRGRARLQRQLGSTANALLRAPQWRAARWGMVLLVVLHLLGLNMWAWQERQALAAKQAALQNTLTQTFPHVKVVVDAPVQMQRELQALRQATGQLSAADLEPLMAAAAQALQGVAPQARATGLEFSHGQLQLRGLALSEEAMSSLHSRLQALPFAYEAQQQGDTVSLRPSPKNTP